MKSYPSIRRTIGDISVPVWALLVGTFINKLGSFLQVFIVLYLVHRGFTAAEAGLALGAYAAGSIAGVVAAGAVTDRIGYRWAIAGSMALAAVLTVGILYVPGVWGIVVLSAAIGAAAQAYRPAAAALMTALTPPAQQTMVFAIFRLAFNLGMTAGPLLGVLLLAQLSYDVLFWADGLTSFVFALFAFALLPRHAAVPEEEAAAAAAEPAVRSGYLRVLSDRRFVLLLAAMFVSQVVYIQYLSVLPLHIQASGFPVQVYGALVSLNALVVILCEVPITTVVQRFPARVAAMVGMGLVGVGLTLYALPAVLVGLVIATLVWSFGETVASPAVTAYPGKVAPPALRGRYNAAAQAAAQLGYTLGPPLGTAIWAVWGGSVWWLCGLLTIVAVVCVGTGIKHIEAEQEAPAPAPGAPATATEGGSD